ncbi:hypothetical protein BH18ACT12_BH18ACT12_24040 [soil metagenome]
MRRAAVLALGLALLGAGCGGKEASETGTRVETEAAGANAPAGFTVRLVKEQGFSLALPKAWQSLDAHEALNSEAMRRFRKINPAVSVQIQALARPNSPIKLLAVGPADRDRFVTNLNVLVTKIPSGLSYEQWSSSEVADLRKAPTIKGLSQEETRLAAGRALHVAYRATFNRESGPFTALIDQYLVKGGSSLYVVTFTTTPRLLGKLEPIFEQAARTFRLTG